MADARLMIGVVGSPERAELAEQIGTFVSHLSRAEPIDGIGARLVAHFQYLVADLVDSRVPRDAGPLPAHEFHRIAQSPLAVHELAHGSTLGAMRSAIDRGIPRRLPADPHPA